MQGTYGISDGTDKKKDKRIKELENQLAQAQAQGGSAGGRTKGHPKGEAKSAGRESLLGRSRAGTRPKEKGLVSSAIHVGSATILRFLRSSIKDKEHVVKLSLRRMRY